MEIINKDDISLICERWANDDGVRLCDKLDQQVSCLAKEIVQQSCKNVETQLMFHKMLSLRLTITEGDINSISTSCKCLINNITSLILYSTNEKNNNVLLFAVLELSLHSLLVAKEDEFCINLVNLILKNIFPLSTPQAEHCNAQSLMNVMNCVLNALIHIEMQVKVKNHSSRPILQLLQMESFHTMISDIFLRVKNDNLSTYMLFTIIPKLVEVSKVHTVIRVLWAGMISSSPKHIYLLSLSHKLSVLCGLADFYVSKGSDDFSIFNSKEFWEIIQEGLISDDALLRKKGLYLLKRSVDVVMLFNLQLTHELFNWNCLKSESLQHFWRESFILFEILEEKQAHLIIPVVQSVLKLFKNVELAHPSWILTVYVRLLSHDSLQVSKLGILNFLRMKIDLYVNCSYKYIIGVLFQRLNNMLLFSCHAGDIEWSEVDFAIKEWFRSILVNTNICKEFFSVIIEAMARIQWCTIPLFHVLYNMSVLPAAEVFDEAKLPILCDFLKEAVRTQNVFIRSAVQCAMLNIVTKFTNKNVNLLHIANMLIAFRQHECLYRGLKSWELTKDWVQSHTSVKGEEILKNILIFENSLSLKSKALCLVLIFDSGLIDLNSKCQEIMNEYFSVIEDTSKSSSYSSVDESDKCLELILHILEDSKSNLFELDLKNDTLIRIITPYINDLIPYITKRLLNVNQLLYFEKVELYIKTLQALTDGRLVLLTDCSHLNSIAIKVGLSPEFHPVQRYFSLKITLWFVKLLINEGKCIDNNLKLYCLSIISCGHLTLQLPRDAKDKQLTRYHQILWGRLVSGYFYALWSILHKCIDAEFMVLTDLLNFVSGDNFIYIGIQSIEIGGQDSLVPILKVVKYVLPYTLSNSKLFNSFVRTTWKSCFELRKVALFWPSIKTWIETIYNRRIIVEEELLPTLINFSDEILIEGETVSGLSNVLISHLKHELKDIELIYPLLGTLTSALLFGPVYKRDQRIENETCALIGTLGSEYAVNDLFPQDGSRSSYEVRACALSILLNVSEHTRGEELIINVLKRLLAKDAELTAERQRYYGDSLHHRKKNRILQALLVMETLLAKSSSLVAKNCVEELVKWSSASLQGESQQPSVRYQLEWLLVRSLLHSPQLIPSFWVIFNQASEERTGSICSFISVAYHLAVSLRDRTFIDCCVTEILPWCMAQHFNVRLYAQVVLQKLWPLDSVVANKYEVISKSLMKNLNQGNAVRNADKLKNDFYFTAFHPLDHFSFETIFSELPRLSNISRDERIPLNFLQQYFGDLDSNHIPLTNKDNLLKQFTAATWVVKATADAEVMVDTLNVQKKFVPWKSMFHELEMPKEQSSTINTELIVVASLIDKVPNLGGLARSCEIFAVQCLVLPSLEYSLDKLFSTLSMSAEKHINIVEVKPHDLPQYLKENKSLGYTIVGAEQTASSVSLESYKFPKKCLLVLGNEKEGIPVNLLPLLDVCVEVRQLGVVRSLNVHVTGALFIWEYTRQCLDTSNTQLAR